MKKLLSKTSNYLLYFEASLWVGIVGAVISMVLKAAFSLSVLHGRIVQGALVTFITGISLFVFVKRNAYKCCRESSIW